MNDAEQQGTERRTGKRGNVYEDNPAATRHLPVALRVARKQRAVNGVEAAAGVVEQARGAAAALDPGAPPAVDHGAAPGARNALLFHQWNKAKK